MDEKFIAALSKIDTSNPKESANSVFRIFSTISTLDESGVIAAYHTFRFYFEDRKGLDDLTEKRIGLIDDALMNRMQHLCVLVPMENRKALALTFVDAIGDPFWFIKFEMLIKK